MGAVCIGRGRKSLSGEMPAMTGASAAGICGLTTFEIWVTPSSWKEWILVAKALSICPAVPENSMVVLAGETLATAKPCDWSHATTACTSESAGPNWLPSCAGVSQW